MDVPQRGPGPTHVVRRIPIANPIVAIVVVGEAGHIQAHALVRGRRSDARTAVQARRRPIMITVTATADTEGATTIRQ